MEVVYLQSRVFSADEILRRAESDIKESRDLVNHLMDVGYIRKPPIEILYGALERAIAQVAPASFQKV